jgi:hypothetical protein
MHPPSCVHPPTENQEPAKSSSKLRSTGTIHVLTGVCDKRLSLRVERIPVLEPVRFRLNGLSRAGDDNGVFTSVVDPFETGSSAADVGLSFLGGGLPLRPRRTVNK